MTKPLSPPSDSRHLFIVRFWHEESESAPAGQWRGSVEHIPTGRRAHFVSLDVLNTFMIQQLNNEAAETIQQDDG